MTLIQEKFVKFADRKYILLLKNKFGDKKGVFLDISTFRNNKRIG